MKIQSDNISLKGYDTRPLKGFLMTGNYGSIAQKLKSAAGIDVYVLKNKELTKTIPPAKGGEHYTDIWAQDLWTVTGNRLLTFFRDSANKKTELFKKFFNLSDSPVQMNKRSKLIKFDTKELERRLYNGIEDDRLLPDFDSYYNVCEKTHIAGGNIFLTKAENGKNNLIIGEDEVKKFTPNELKTMYNADNICYLPQLDYHLDLFIRPLNNNVVLLADESMTEQLLKTIIKKLDKYINKFQEQESTRTIDSIIAFIKNLGNGEAAEKEDMPVVSFYKSAAAKIKKCISTNSECRSVSGYNAGDVEKKLTDAGYKVIRVPASLHNAISRKEYCEGEGWYHKRRCLNYINACTFLNKNNEIVYITNKDMLRYELDITPEMKEITGVDFEEEFKKSVRDYIKPENIYFLSGEGNALGYALLNNEGGLHCMSVEIPAE